MLLWKLYIYILILFYYNTLMLSLFKMLSPFKTIGSLLPAGAVGTFMAIFVFSAVFPANAKNPSVDEISKYFIKIVFGSEYGNISNKPKVISKWSGNIGISIQGRATNQLAAITGKHLNSLSRITGLRFKQVAANSPMQSISIIFLKRDEMFAIKGEGIDPNVIKKLASSGGCYFMAFHKPPQRIVKAIIAVNIERPIGLTDSCILEEITQSLGLPNDSNKMRPSIFSDLDHETNLSRTDKILVRTLYDKRMVAGDSVEDAFTKAQKIILELNTDIQ